MFNLFAQTAETITLDEGVAAAIFAGFIGLILIFIPIIIFTIVAMWKVFVKAGREGWAALIPVYSGWVNAEIAGKPGWWALVGLGGAIPFFGFAASIGAFVLSIIVAIELAKAFGKDPVFSLLLIFVPPVGYGILGFGKATYTKPVITGPTGPKNQTL